MKDEESIDPVACPRYGDGGSAGSNSPDESGVDNVCEASSGLEDPSVEPAEQLNPA